jgi:hypothetical protein
MIIEYKEIIWLKHISKISTIPGKPWLKFVSKDGSGDVFFQDIGAIAEALADEFRACTGSSLSV